MRTHALPFARTLLVLAAIVGPAAAADGSPEDLREALRAGNYAEAAAIGERDGSALGLALAAKALSDQARCTLDGDPEGQRPLFERAFDLAGRAVALDPGEPEAWMQRARSYARLLNYAKDTFDIDQALEAVRRLDSMLERANALAPERAEAAMARGRVEIGKLVESRAFTGGMFSLFGDRQQAFRDICRALRLVEGEPADASRALVYYTIADALWALDSREYAGSVDYYLKKALEPCDDAGCRCVQGEAKALRETVRAATGGTVPLARRICPAP